ncbi:6-phosphogluconate dehydrogenase C-terminal domain-like protein [Trematosphaeria pertusa]|uniref:6-phosphogluconate dehydrogenase C-terminal domain-like protein n=1 Tax=Trematosphaeria pertusa TaxID=390896 RepID=A0A6A6IWZ8_9PLEO|nr:6-phosphogluconate dehydrogenase C-terminal domain-like protein [Trematosphaeria pertusa]KAF2255071.1 6-phosphogluconate dehydrogenase C-terminal domain-like protein [Trematosphaeria pertusa]
MAPLASIGILSIGQMGLGIARLLVAHNYRVLTNVSNRSQSTQERAKSASLVLVPTDADLVQESDYILSIVPPRDAVATAKRIVDACREAEGLRAGKKEPLYYLDLNAVSPSTARSIDELFRSSAPSVRFIDGGIIGGPPTPSSSTNSSEWTRPGIPLSGSHSLDGAPISGAHLAETLNTRYLDANIGSASGLKCTFAALSKGFTALALQSFTTATNLGVLPHLQHYLGIYNPSVAARAEKSIIGCTGKAYRWVEEMHQIGECFAEEGGWREQAKVFREIAGVYEGLAKVVERRGTEGMRDAEGVVGALGEGLKGRERRVSVEKLEQDDR